MDAEDRRLLGRTLDDATSRYSGDDLDRALEDLGWPDALSVDAAAAVSLLFGRQGAANATSSALGQVVAHGLGIEGVRGAAMVLPAMGRWDPPGSIEGDQLVVRGLGPAGLARCETAVVVTGAGGRWAAFDVPTAALHLRSVEGMDPRLALVEVTGGTTLPADGSGAIAGDWPAALALGRLALAHELVGGSRTMLELACEHARDRIQFGQPIGTFQAVRHRLADTLVGIETADAMLDAAWVDRAPGTAAMAKSVAGRQARATARHCQQVLAGIGFTTEHPLHHFVRRALVLDGLLGGAVSLTRSLGNQVVDTLQLPALPPL
jgi:hypothetical protein